MLLASIDNILDVFQLLNVLQFFADYGYNVFWP